MCQPRQNAQTIRLAIPTKSTGKSHLSNSCWNVNGAFFAGAALPAGFLEAVVFIGLTRLSAGLPPKCTTRGESVRDAFYTQPGPAKSKNFLKFLFFAFVEAFESGE